MTKPDVAPPPRNKTLQEQKDDFTAEGGHPPETVPGTGVQVPAILPGSKQRETARKKIRKSNS